MNPEQENAACRKCETILTKTDELPFLEERYLVLHVEASLINDPPDRQSKKQKLEEKNQRKEKRDRFCRDLKRCVSALRNSGGGVVLVHISGLEETDSCLHHFHELVDPRLNEIKGNESLFVNIYRKNWIRSFIQERQADTPHEPYLEFVAVGVVPSCNVVTVDFNTKVPQDFSIVDPTFEETVSYLRAAVKFQKTKPRLRGLEILEESRNIQHKAVVVENAHLFDKQIKEPSKFAKYIWQTLKLGYCISAFSKVEGGGSFYLGVVEKERTFESYVTKTFHIKGFEYNDDHLDDLKDSIRQQIKDQTVVLFFDSATPPAALPDECVEIKFYKTSLGSVVCEVSIAAVNGLVFHDKKGPEAYELDSGNILSPLDLQDWKKRLIKEA